MPKPFREVKKGEILSFSRTGFPSYFKRSTRSVEMRTRSNGETSLPGLWFYARQNEPCFTKDDIPDIR